jgi:hypothetical protein
MVITTYLTSHIDTQRGIKWTPDKDAIKVIDSCECLVLHDCFDFDEYKGSKFIRVQPKGNPYFDRWRLYAEYAEGFTWCVDATDVTQLREPAFKERAIYCGLDRGNCDSKWLRKNHPYDFTHLHGKPMLNAGVVGAYAEDIKEMAKFISKGKGTTDMGAFNLYVHGKKYITEGVCTDFKEYKDNGAVWMHK